MRDLNKWYLGGMVDAADKAEFKEDEHPRGKGGRFVKKGEDEVSQLAEEFSKSLSEKFNIPQKSLSERIKQETKRGNVYSAEDAHKVAKKFNDEISGMSKQYAENVSKKLGMKYDECYKKIREAAFNGDVYSQEDAYRVCKSANREGGGSDGVAGKVAAYREKHEAFAKELLKDLNSPVAEKMRGELQSMLSELDGMGVDVERLGIGKDDKIPMKAEKAEFKKGEGGGGLSALGEAYKKGGFKHPEELAKADFEELGKMNDSRLDAEITMLKGKVEEGGKSLDKARLEAAKWIMDGRKSTNKD